MPKELQKDFSAKIWWHQNCTLGQRSAVWSKGHSHTRSFPVALWELLQWQRGAVVSNIPCFPENKIHPENKAQLKLSARQTHWVRYDDVPGEDDMTVFE